MFHLGQNFGLFRPVYVIRPEYFFGFLFIYFFSILYSTSSCEHSLKTACLAEADLPDSMEKSSTIIPFVGESHRIWRQILLMSFECEEPERMTRMYEEEASKSSRERVAAEERERE
jgi:hypothetical protein